MFVCGSIVSISFSVRNAFRQKLNQVAIKYRFHMVHSYKTKSSSRRLCPSLCQKKYSLVIHWLWLLYIVTLLHSETSIAGLLGVKISLVR